MIYFMIMRKLLCQDAATRVQSDTNGLQAVTRSGEPTDVASALD